MTAAPSTVEVIDLTCSSMPTTPKSSTHDADNSTPAGDTSRRARRARKRKAQEAEALERGVKRKSPDTPAEQEPESRKRRDVEDDSKLDAEESATEQLFFVDVEAVPVPQPPPPQKPPSSPKVETNNLLLPSHVTVFGSTPVEIIAPTTSLEDDSIQFLDYDDSRQFARYYQTEEQKVPSRIVCKKCGAENQHKSFACTVVICLTCGVRDEHPTRSCPISKVCFNCQMKGHISQKCPNRHSKGIPSSRFMDCDRCYSSRHKTNECPTWWRMYLYLSDEGRSNVLSFREERQDLALGEGGEGYVANDEWCYNCGTSGHWGDDCPDNAPPEEPSAFSSHNVASGPFYDPSKDGEPSKKSRPRRKEAFLELEHVPDDVGRSGKEKAKSRLGKMLKDKIADDDQDDWFSRKSGGSARPSDNFKKPPPTGPKGKSSFTFNSQSFRDRRDLQGGTVGGSSGGQPSLLSRLGDSYHSGGSKDKPYQGYQGEGVNGGGSSSKSSSKRKREKRERQPSPDQPDYRSRGGSSHRKHDRYDSRKDRHDKNGGGGPRYRGSYIR